MLTRLFIRVPIFNVHEYPFLRSGLYAHPPYGQLFITQADFDLRLSWRRPVYRSVGRLTVDGM